jgi:hypothetical protein
MRNDGAQRPWLIGFVSEGKGMAVRMAAPRCSHRREEDPWHIRKQVEVLATAATAPGNGVA